MAMAMATTTKNVQLVLLLLAVLPLATLSSRTSPPSSSSSAHKSHGGHGHRSSSSSSAKHPPPPPASISPSSPPSAPPTPPPPAQPTAAAAALVRATCNSTAYYDLCVSALGADPSSATADGVRGLSAIAVSVAANNASGGAATAAALANGTATSSTADGTVQALLHACAAKYDSARDALGVAGESIALEDYDFASVHVSVAAEYPQVCRTLFQRRRPGQYPAELAAREETLRQLCSVALDIIALVSNSS